MRTNPLLASLVLSLVAVACSDKTLAPSAPIDNTSIAGDANVPGKHLVVMSRNLYLGASLDPVIGAPSPQLIPIRVAGVWTSVQATNFPERAKAIADEITEAQPDLIGLQEVSLWRTQFPGDAHLPNGQAANDTAYDFLKILLAELEARGQKYVVASEASGVDAELFMFTGTPGASLTRDIRMTDRDVILAKQNVTLSNAAGGQYTAKVTVPIGGAGGPVVSLPRTWVSVDAKYHGESFRFFNTHLEVDTPPFDAVQVAQGWEAIAMLGASPLPVVAVGDYNSATDHTQTPTYANLIRSGLVDVWAQVNPLSPGFTAGMTHDLLGPVSLFKTRIDLAMFKGPMLPVAAYNVGNLETDRTESGLMPSDHAGLVATIRLGVK